MLPPIAYYYLLCAGRSGVRACVAGESVQEIHEVPGKPTLTLHGGLDPVNLPQMSEGKDAYFSGPYERRLIAGAGHFPQREKAADAASEVVGWLWRFR